MLSAKACGFLLFKLTLFASANFYSAVAILVALKKDKPAAKAKANTPPQIPHIAMAEPPTRQRHVAVSRWQE